MVLLYEEELAYAKRFTLAHYEGGYSVFTIPGTDENRQYLIVPEGKEAPENLPENTMILRQPVAKICFASGSLASLTGAVLGLEEEAEEWFAGYGGTGGCDP